MLAAGCGGPTPPADPASPAGSASPAAAPSSSAPAAPAPPPYAGRRYVALGDSYTASPDTGAPAGDPPGCQRSVNNYPHLVAQGVGADLTDVSCSGATTKDLRGPQATPNGSNPAQTAALTPDTALVTVGIGGNDIGFGEVVGSCVTLDPAATPCRQRFAGHDGDVLRARVAEVGVSLTRILADVHRRSPHARVAVVGYPQILPADGPGCFPAVPMSPPDVDYLRGVFADLDSTLRRTAGAGGATYVDTAGPSAEHDMCRAPGQKWIEGYEPASPAAPLHPNALGQEGSARAVLAALGASGR